MFYPLVNSIPKDLGPENGTRVMAYSFLIIDKCINIFILQAAV